MLLGPQSFDSYGLSQIRMKRDSYPKLDFDCGLIFGSII
jgi:hypothetical protein